MPAFTSALRLNKIPILGLVPEVSATAPASPTDGQLWTDTSVAPSVTRRYNSTNTTWEPWLRIGTTTGFVPDAGLVVLKANNLSDLANVATARTNLGLGTAATTNTGTGPTNTILGNDARLTDMRVPTDASVTGGVAGAGVKLAANTITHDNVAAANKDGVAATPSMRTLGTGAQQAVSGTDARLSDTRTPTAGSVVDASVAAGAAIAESKLALASDAAAGTASRRTLGYTGNAAMPGVARLDQIAIPTSAVSMNSQRITNLAAPVAASDAARLLDVQNAAAGIDSKPSVRTLATTNVSVATGLASGQVVSGVTLVTGDRVLLTGQTTATENGVYDVPASGAASRSSDTLTPNSTWYVEEGTNVAETAWWITNNGTITPGTTALVISQFSGGAAYTGGTGITVSGLSISIAASYVGQTSITTLGTITTGVWNGTAIAVANGGTGGTTPAQARTNLNVSQIGYAATLGAVTAGTPLVVTHNLGTQDVVAQVRDTSTNEVLYMDIINASTNTVTITSGIAFGANALRIVVVPYA